MLTAFWSSIGGKFADRFVALSAPALAFWLGGLLAWSSAHGGLHALTIPAAWLDRKSALTQVVVLLIIIFGLTASGLVVNRLTMPVLRILEGYWPARPARLQQIRRDLVTRLQNKAKIEEDAWQELTAQIQPPATPTAEQLASIARLDRRRHRRPDAPNLFMPTRIGNLLRAAETRPYARYGLNAVVVWPRLWLVLPDTTRKELASARTVLDNAVAASIWGVLFCVFIPWTFLALPVGLTVATVAVTVWVPTRAEVFGELVVAAFDMHRTAVYRELRWPLPANPKEERDQGKALTTYLQVGSDDPAPTFTSPG